MPDATPVYGWPIPVLTDDPNIPADVTALANAVEDTVSTVTSSTTVVSDGPIGSVSVSGSDWTTIATVAISLASTQEVEIVGWARLTNTGSGRAMVALQVCDGTEHLFGTGQTHMGGTSDSFGEAITLSTPRRRVGLLAGAHTLHLQAYKDGNGVVNTNRSDTYASQGIVTTGIEASY